MGRNFLLNIAKHGIASVGYDVDAGKRELLLKEGAGMPLDVGNDLTDFLSKLESPRNIMLLVPAGPIVDSVIGELSPLLAAGDLIIDGGDSHFSDTDRREAELLSKNLGFLGVGVIGSESRGRHGASIMVGGRLDFYERVETALKAAAFDFNGPCLEYLGAGSAGHFVKMVHDGIESALMQLIAEVYDYMRRVLRMNIVLTGKAFAEWNDDELSSYLLAITARILNKYDRETRNPLIDMIVDAAGQNATLKWTSQAAMEFGVPIPTIDAAVSASQISARKLLRQEIAQRFQVPANGYKVLPKADLEEVRDALYCGSILAYEQGFSLLREVSREKSYGLDLEKAAGVWRYSSIIFSSVLEKIRKAYAAEPALRTLLLHEGFSDILYKHGAGLRRVVSSMSSSRIPAAALSASLNYYTSFRTERLPAFLTQAQRDYAGAHKYQRIDKEGTFHTDDWDDPTLSTSK